MKLRLRQSMLLVFLFLLLPVITYGQAQITESKLMAYVNTVDSASRRGNINAVVATLAKDVKITMRVVAPSSNEEKVLMLTRDKYAFYTKAVMRRRLAYTLVRKNTRFKIYEDGMTANVTSDIYETLTLRQGTLRAVSSESAIVTLRNGRLVVTSVESRTRFY